MASRSDRDLWRREFGDAYDVPAVLTNAEDLVDTSWHNDVCPSFETAWMTDEERSADEIALRLWVDHRDPAEREYGWEPAARYGVATRDETILSTNDLDDALECFRREAFRLYVLPRFPVGTRVRLAGPVDRYPFCLLDAGTLGVVAVADEDAVGVRLDDHVEGLDEWDNVLRWERPAETLYPVYEDLEVVTESQS